MKAIVQEKYGSPNDLPMAPVGEQLALTSCRRFLFSSRRFWRTLGGMFAEPPSSRLDLRFRLFGIPIRVHPMFWLIAVLLGWRLPAAEQILWVVVVFFSILVHEIGHAFSARTLGQRTHVVLHSLGGLTIFDENRSVRPGWQQAFIAFCGPFAGFILAGVVYTFMPLLVDTRSGAFGALYFHLLWVNIVWGLVNLLPVWPLDGGQRVRSLMVEFAGDRGFSISSILSFVELLSKVVFWQLIQAAA